MISKIINFRHKLSAIKVGKIADILDIYEKYDVIAIDEGQFFPDVI